MEYLRIGDMVVMHVNHFDEAVKIAAETGSRAGVDSYRNEMMKEEKLNTSQVAKKLGVSIQTVVRYIHNGKKSKGRTIKLKSEKIGNEYLVNALDLEDFKEAIK